MIFIINTLKKQTLYIHKIQNICVKFPDILRYTYTKNTPKLTPKLMQQIQSLTITP